MLMFSFPLSLSDFRTYLWLIIPVLFTAILAGCDKETAITSEETPSSTIMQNTLPVYDNENVHEQEAHMKLRHFAPVFPEPLSDLNTSLRTIYYSEAGTSYPVQGADGEFIIANTSELGPVSIPQWYGMFEAEEVQPISPSRIQLSADARLFLNPGSSLHKEAKDLPSDSIYSVLRWEEWYGVLLPPEPWYEDYQLYRPVLLWLHESDMKHSEQIEGGIWHKDSEIPVESIRHITEVLLHKGTEEDYLLQLLGPPHSVETSKNLNPTGEPIRLGHNWRYEHADAHFVVTVSGEGSLEEWHWILPLTDESQSTISSYQYPSYGTYSFRKIPIATSKQVEWEWRNQGKLSFTYLLAATDDILLLLGDDGGYSGMHYDSSLYAIDRHNGDTLWELDAGHGLLSAYVDSNEEQVTVFTSYDAGRRDDRQMVRQIRLADGEELWQYMPTPARELFVMSRTQDTVLLYSQPFEKEAKGQLLVLDAGSGNPAWHTTFDKPYQIINRSTEEPYILLLQDETLTAMDSATGKPQWSLSADRPLPEEMVHFPHTFIESRLNPFHPQQSLRWVQLGGERLQLDVNTGEVKARYPLKANEIVTAVDERYLLIQKSLNHSDFWKASQFETSFYDLVEGSIKWTLPGKVSSAEVDGDYVYVVADGIPAQVNKYDGRLQWQMQTTGLRAQGDPYTVGSIVVVGNQLLVPYGADLLIVNKQNGQILNRIQDVLIGYPDLQVTNMINGLLTHEEGAIYLGSANGYFSKLRSSEL